MTEPARIYSAPVTVITELTRLGLSEADIRSAVEFALPYALEANTDLDPLGASGSAMYAKLHRGLREVLTVRGWTIDRADNYESTVHPDGTHAIAVMAGNANTGNPDRRPAAKRDQGPGTRSIVETNWVQETMFVAGEVQTKAGKGQVPRLSTWMLVHYIDEDEEIVRVEVSLPLVITESGRVIDWAKRIILAPVPFTGEAASFPIESDSADDDAYQADIEKKAT